jgi:peptidylprolyl isomerase
LGRLIRLAISIIPPMPKHRVVVALVSLALAAGACGRPVQTNSSQSTPGASEVTVSGPAGQKPTIIVPDGSPPASLQVKDIIVGSGAEAAAGRRLQVQYVGLSWSTKRQFDASWDRNQPFPFILGQGAVIQGWDLGLQGMHTGGRRLLIIPPNLGYGPQGGGPIGPNETLVFVVDLLKVR